MTDTIARIIAQDSTVRGEIESRQQFWGTKPTSEAARDESWHVLDIEEMEGRLQTAVVRGLSNAEAARRLDQFDQNALAAAKGRSALSILLVQFYSLIVLLLVAATGVASARLIASSSRLPNGSSGFRVHAPRQPARTVSSHVGY